VDLIGLPRRLDSRGQHAARAFAVLVAARRADGLAAASAWGD
jgi:hypothetical protein